MVMVDLEDLRKKLNELLGPIFDADKKDLIELNVCRHGGDLMVEIIADRPDGGITMGECSNLNRRSVEVIDQSLIMDQEYSLELSSPGLDRPLKTKKDFLRVINQNIRCLLNKPIKEKQEHTGILKQVDDHEIIVETKKYGKIVIPMEIIFKALLEL